MWGHPAGPEHRHLTGADVGIIGKEVPVNKVVFTEVPKEIIHKELVYVPLFTDDPELLNVRPAGEGGRGRSAKVKKPKAK